VWQYNFCKIEVEEEYKSRIEKKEAFVTAVACYKLYLTQRSGVYQFKRLENKAEKKLKNIQLLIEVSTILPFMTSVDVDLSQTISQAPVVPPTRP
ncbi:4578_t:CDS:1, partial [Dentiscutata heterogama]